MRFQINSKLLQDVKFPLSIIDFKRYSHYIRLHQQLKNKVKKLINLGIKDHYEPWEISFTRKINLISLIGFFNVTFSFFVLPLLGIYNFQIELISCMIITPLIFLANVRLNYIVSTYMFYITGFVLMYFLMVKMGIDSYNFLFFFPISLSIVQLLGRKETLKHMMILLFFALVMVVAVVVSYKHKYLVIDYSASVLSTLQLFNLALSAYTCLTFISILTMESIRQETKIKQMLKEKEILLAEVYHRVKNNMSIVTSLLNLKKNTSDSDEVKEALEACRNRVFSMSLVHEKFFVQNNPTGINFKQYATALVKEISLTFGDTEQTIIAINSDEFSLEITQAIPCGLIINELITNSFKHAEPENQKLKIEIRLLKSTELIRIIIRDNGKGFDPETARKNNSMGLDLIHSLCEQIDGKCSYNTKNGMEFTIEFKHNS